MTFKEGQKVVCVDARSLGYCKYPLQKGKIYTVASNYSCACGSRQISIVEQPEVLTMLCGCYRTAVRRQSYYNWRFIPLDLLTNFISLPSHQKSPNKIEA